MVKKQDILLVLGKIEKLKTEIEAMQADPLLKENYREKIRELMYWRRRRIQLGRKK